MESCGATSGEEELNKLLKEWCQGDAILSVDLPFIHLADFAQPLTDLSREVAQSDPQGEGTLGTVATDVPGFIILTQTCDLVRNYQDRPYIDLAPLRKVTAQDLKMIKGGYRPQYAFVPGLEEHMLVTDLNRIMTAEKAVLLSISPSQRVRGCPNDQDARSFAVALGRKYDRTAFPDEFNRGMDAVAKRIRSKHGRASDEGLFLAKLKEIRVHCSPTWQDQEPKLTLLFIFRTPSEIPPKAAELAESLLGRFEDTERFKDPSFRIVTYETLTAAAYLESDPLDLDHLSDSEET